MITVEEIKTSLEKMSLDQLWSVLKANNMNIAVWSLPNSEQSYLIADHKPISKVSQLNIESSKPGFVMCDFKGDASFINANFQATFNKAHFLDEIICDDIAILNKIKESIIEPFVLISKKIAPIAFIKDEERKLNFIEKVKLAVACINEGGMKKVVLSRQKKGIICKDFCPLQSFNKLSKAYPSAFVSLIYLAETETFWLGATPEILVSLGSDGVFKTMSLAGTQSAIDSNGNAIAETDARWSQKEIEEQALVSRYIIDSFKKIRLREFVENGPKTVKAGNLLHLRTDYTVDTKSIGIANLASTMLHLLHPTSAVCGMPLDESKQFIEKYEGYSRDLYSGYIGPINFKYQNQVFVNLRTMKIQGDLATFYAGAGITEDSNPEKEWIETEMKINTLLNVINL